MPVARLAIIGLGRMASTIDDEVIGYPSLTLPYSIAASCAASDKLALVAGCDLLAEKREAFTARWGVTAVYDDYAAMITTEQPDIVAICTRGENHAELCVAVAGLGVELVPPKPKEFDKNTSIFFPVAVFTIFNFAESSSGVSKLILGAKKLLCIISSE